ncbi:Fructosamine kinase-domain-containing protein [Aspergillus karnatakaensis]|uniref:Fructosamine kinase-domain-containing protein n=1 Tax=Aspergillus karnatakaensis TaxID=1810916 RepID=UPI003CCCAA3C
MASTDLNQGPLLSSVSQRLPDPGSRIIDLTHHGASHFGQTFRVTVQLSSGLTVNYFLKPADPQPLARALATMHQASCSPTGKFGFHTPTCHTRNVQSVAFWTDSWCELFTAHLSRILSTASTVFACPTFTPLGNIVLSTVVPALLRPLQSNARTLKPCLVHGDCWDMNTAIKSDGRAVFFDVASFYAHNEYDVGNWRAARHGLSERSYIDAYKELVPPSEPVEDWDNRNLLYSLPFNICNALFVPGSTQKTQ